MSPHFPIGAHLNSSMVLEWAQLNIQTPVGQTLALEIGVDIFEKAQRKLDASEEWAVVLVACGLWAKAKETLLPVLMIGSGRQYSFGRSASQ